jgi:hypothetical protein
VSAVVLDEIAAMPLETYRHGQTAPEHVLRHRLTMPGESPLLERLVEYGQSTDGWADRSFTPVEYKTRDVCGVDEAEWKHANPALGDFLAIDSMRALVKTVPENAFVPVA